jgi:hypothetical protein
MYFMGDWDFLHFKPSPMPEKKYAAVLQERFGDHRIVEIDFGRPGYWHFKDSTGLNLYSKLDHMDLDRRQRFKERFSHYIIPNIYTAAYFSFNYLW